MELTEKYIKSDYIYDYFWVEINSKYLEVHVEKNVVF